MAILVCCIFAGTVDKSKVEILQNFVAFSEYTNFKNLIFKSKNYLDPLRISWHVKITPMNFNWQASINTDNARIKKLQAQNRHFLWHTEDFLDHIV